MLKLTEVLETILEQKSHTNLVKGILKENPKEKRATFIQQARISLSLIHSDLITDKERIALYTPLIHENPHNYMKEHEGVIESQRLALARLLMEHDAKYSELVLAFTDYNDFRRKSALAKRNNFDSESESLVSKMQSGEIVVKVRGELENNPRYKQIIAGGVIVTSDNKYILLKTLPKGNTRITDRYTMIQGHAEFIVDDILKPFNNYIVEQWVREVNEEVNFDTAILKPSEVMGMTNSSDEFILNNDDENESQTIGSAWLTTSDNFVSIEHVGAIFYVHIPKTSEELIQAGIKTGEGDKHSVEILSKDELMNASNEGLCDGWLQAVIENIL